MKLIKKATAVVLVAALGISPLLSVTPHAAELEFAYFQAFTSDTTFIPPYTGKYKIYCVGKSGDGSENMVPDSDGVLGSGGGGGSGGIAISILQLKQGIAYNVAVTDEKSGFGENFYATAGATPTGRKGGIGGTAYGGNVSNEGGYKGGDGGKTVYYSENTHVGETGVTGENGGMRGGSGHHSYWTATGGAGGGARLPAVNCPYVSEEYTKKYYAAGGWEHG